MGYTTDFSGRFELDKPLSVAQKNYLEKFAHTRRMKRNAAAVAKRPDPVREAVGLPIGDEGGFFVGEGGDYGQGESFGDRSKDILNYNSPPAGQPGLWNQWTPTEDGKGIEWDGGEKFYEYVAWIEYIIESFLKPWGFKLNGEVEWVGEDSDDRGLIVVKDNVVKAKQARIVYDED